MQERERSKNTKKVSVEHGFVDLIGASKVKLPHDMTDVSP
jgi:hypothetical protein